MPSKSEKKTDSKTTNANKAEKESNTKSKNSKKKSNEEQPDTDDAATEEKVVFACIAEINKAIHETTTRIKKELSTLVTLQKEQSRMNTKNERDAGKKKRRADGEPPKVSNTKKRDIPALFYEFVTQCKKNASVDDTVLELLNDQVTGENCQIPRTLVQKVVHAYIKFNDLHSKDDNKIYTPDKHLKKLLSITKSDDVMKFTNVQKFISRLFPVEEKSTRKSPNKKVNKKESQPDDKNEDSEPDEDEPETEDDDDDDGDDDSDDGDDGDDDDDKEESESEDETPKKSGKSLKKK